MKNMKKQKNKIFKKYSAPSLRYTSLVKEVFICGSPGGNMPESQVQIDDTEGIWQADANEESSVGNIWD